LIKLKRMLTKQLVQNALSDLPDKFTLDEIMQRMYVLHKIESARKKSKAGKVYSETEAKRKLAKWLK
jgi:hypothetical protein